MFFLKGGNILKSIFPGLLLKIPVIGPAVRQIYRRIKPFSGSADYWKKRYATGGNSGPGSYGKLAEFKAEVINKIVAEERLESIIEFGCGDGNQLNLVNYPSYIGFDVSETAITLCKKRFVSDGNKVFKLMREYGGEKADLALSLDVIYHLVEDNIFENHMSMLFKASNRYVIIYSSNHASKYGGTHIKYREFTKWIQDKEPTWKLINHIPNKYPYTGDENTGSRCVFFFYYKV